MKRWKICLLLFIVVSSVAGCEKMDTTGTAEPAEEVANVFNKAEKKTVITTDAGLCEVLEKKDASEQAKYNAMNRMFSSNADESQQSLFCIDETTGAVYFVNQNKDWYIYRLQNGEVKLAVSLPARELYIWEGTIYFMLDSYGEYDLGEGQNGDIYAYTPEDGSVKFLYSASKHGNIDYRLTVKEEGIYFSCSREDSDVVLEDGSKVSRVIPYYGYLPFGGTEAVKDENKTTIAGWREYYFVQRMDEENTICLYLESKIDKSRIKVGKVSLSCVMDERMYYTVAGEGVTVWVQDMESGEKWAYNCEDSFKSCVGELAEKTIINSFVVIEEDIWVVAGSLWLLHIKMQSGEVTCYRMYEERGMLKHLYTDGEQLYATYSANSVTVGYPVRVLTEQPGWNEMKKVQTLDVEYLTE